MIMKRIICIFLVLSGSYLSFSQELRETTRWSVLNGHFGISGFNGLFNVKTPSFGMSYEIKPGRRFSFGGYLGYTSMEYVGDTYGIDDSDENVSGLNLGIMANTHFIESETTQVYLGLTMGYQSHDFGPYSSGGFLWEPHFGVRKYIDDSIALHGELGLGLALIKLGASYKL